MNLTPEEQEAFDASPPLMQEMYAKLHVRVDEALFAAERLNRQIKQQEVRFNSLAERLQAFSA